MLDYAENQKDCRSQAIALYFGDLSTKPCGTCDNCLRTKKQSITGVDFEEIKTAVLQLLKNQSLSPTAMIGMLKNKNEEQVMKVLDFLQAEEMVQVNTDGTISRC
jgi:ATP-dependent DNA helicase RecQ